MKLGAKSRLSAANNNSVLLFIQRIAKQLAGQIPIDPKSHDCRATVARGLALNPEPSLKIWIVGLDGGHAVHTFLTDDHNKIVADSYSGTWDGQIYRCTMNGEPEQLIPLFVSTAADFKSKYVRPLLASSLKQDQVKFHGHVVPLPSGARAKCGGPSNRVLNCQVCARELELLASGLHPFAAGAGASLTLDGEDLPHPQHVQARNVL